MGLQEIKGSVALVTGANRGIGKAFVEALLKQGAKQIYAAVRNLETAEALKADFPNESNKIIPVHLDITNESQVSKAVDTCQDVNLLINNAGICFFDKTLEAARAEIETNCFGTWAMCQAFAPVLGKNGGGAIVNMLSTAALVNFPVLGSYCVSKAANLSVTQMFRAILASQETLVIGVVAGPTDTELMAALDLPKVPPSQIAEVTLDAVIKGIEDVYPDEFSAQLRDSIAADPKAVEKHAALEL